MPQYKEPLAARTKYTNQDLATGSAGVWTGTRGFRKVWRRVHRKFLTVDLPGMDANQQRQGPRTYALNPTTPYPKCALPTELPHPRSVSSSLIPRTEPFDMFKALSITGTLAAVAFTIGSVQASEGENTARAMTRQYHWHTRIMRSAVASVRLLGHFPALHSALTRLPFVGTQPKLKSQGRGSVLLPPGRRSHQQSGGGCTQWL